MPPLQAFLPSYPISCTSLCPTTSVRSQTAPTRPPKHVPHRPTRLSPISLSSPPPKVEIGSIVAIHSPPAVSLAQVTGKTSSGDTLDIQPLESFVKELYIMSKSPATYISSSSCRPIRAEYVPSQNGWIVLNQDLEQVRNYFTSAPANLRGRVEVVDQVKEPLSEDALKKQLFPRPTRQQAFLGAALSLPLSAAFYSTFAAARDSYAANPAGEDFLTGAIARQIILFATAGASALAIIVGCALFLSALDSKEETG